MLYHADVFMPRKIKNMIPAKAIRPVYSRHAIDASNTDRYGRLALPDTIDLSKATLIEVEKYNTGMVKIVIRVKLNDTIDLCLAIIPQGWIVKTVWANEVGDSHGTLDRSRYVKLGE